MRFQASRLRPFKFLLVGLAVALGLVGYRLQISWPLFADEADSTTSLVPGPEIPFELLYSRKGSVYRNLRYAIESEDETRAMALVQSILDDSEDHFVSTESGRVVSLKRLALDYLESLPKDSLKQYQRKWDLDADVLLDVARESGQADDYEKIADRYYFTNSGFEAIDWLAMRSLDLGQFHTASRLWNDVIDSKVHAHRIGPQLLMKAAVANRLAGDGERAAELMTMLVSTKAGQNLSLKLENYLKSQAENSSTVKPQGKVELVDSWKMPLMDSLSEEETDLLKEWRQEAWVNRKILAVARSAIVEGDQLAIRDYNRILLMDPKTGKPQASYAVSPNLREAAEDYERKQFVSNQWERIENRAEFLEKFVWNTLHSQLSHDRRHVYVVEKDDEWKQRKQPNVNPNSQRGNRGNRFENRAFGDPVNDPVPGNRLVALPLKRFEKDEIAEWKPVWQVTPWDEEHPEFEGVYFLSLPVNVDGLLYAVVEQSETIKLFCLDPSNGKLLWSQGLGFPMNTLFEDSSRKWRGCVVRPAGDKLIVTTQVGLIVGIDPVRRVLEWVYYLGDTRNRRQFAFRGRELDLSYGSLGFVDEPMISGQRLLLLPRQSSELHCVDLDSGRIVWKIPRNKPTQSSDESMGDEYLGGVSRDVLLVVGARETRGVAISDGRELWRIAHPRISGHGVQQGDGYILPLENSQLLRVQISSGQKQFLNVNSELRASNMDLSGIAGDQSIEEYPAPVPEFGHLIVADRHLISFGIKSLIALPEPESHLETLRVLAAAGKLNHEQMFKFITLNSGLSPQDRITQYEQLITQELSAPLRKRVETEYEQELFRWIRQHPEDVAAVSKKLSPFHKTAEDQIRLAIHLSRQQMELGDLPGVLDSFVRLGRLQSDGLFEMPGEDNLSISLGAWMRTIWDWSRNQPDRDSFDSYLTGRIEAAMASDDSAAMRTLLDQLPGLVELDQVRLALARLSQQEQRFHEAEMLLLTVISHQDDKRGLAATIELATLWSRFGLFDRAAAILKQADTRLSGNWPAALKMQRVALENSLEMRKAVSNLQLPSHELSQVTVNSLLPGSPQRMIAEAYEGYRRIYPTPPECDFDLLAKSHPDSNQSNKHMLHIVSRSKGTVAATVPLPLRGSAGASSYDSVVGHFFPFGSMGQVRGLSLMDTAESQPAWTRSFLDPDMGEMLFVGPFTSEFAAFRHRDAILVVNSRNGKVFWRRDELEAQKTSNSNPRLAMFGDERILVRLPSNEDNYEVYETFTGRLRNPPALPRTGLLGSVGRLLVMLRYSGSNNQSGRQPSVSVVDMETGEEVFASRYFSPHCCHLDGHHLVLIDHEKQLRVVDLKTLKEVVSIPTEFSESASVTRLNFWSDAANHYINIRRVDDHQRVREEGGDRIFSNFASNPFLPTTDVVGLLIAVDQQTGRRRWDRIMSSCSVVQSPHEALPFLTTLSWRTQQRVPNTRRLHVEVISLENGGTLGESNDFVPLDQFMQLFQSRYDRESGRLELNGPMYRVQIDFNNLWDRLLPDPEPS